MAKYPDTLPFGKFKGYKITEVPIEYLEWFADNVQPVNDSLQWIVNEVKDEVEYRIDIGIDY